MNLPLSLAAALLTSQPATPGGPARPSLKPDPLPVSALRVFTDARDNLRAGPPFAHRTAVTIKDPGRTPVSAVFTLRIAPGKQRDQRDATLSIEAGDLRLHAAASKEGEGQLTCVLTSNRQTFFRATYSGPPDPAMLKELLQPIPAPTHALFFLKDGEPLSDPIAQASGVQWQGTSLTPDGPDPLTLNGTRLGHTATATFERATLRLRALTVPITDSPDPRTVSVTITSVDAGEPAAWAIDLEGRQRVDSLRLLPVRKPRTDTAIPDDTPGSQQAPPPPAPRPD